VTKTPLTRQLDRLTGQILVIAGLALIASMALNLARGETFIAVFNAAVAFAIAAIPVGLPTWSRPSWPGGRNSSPRPARS
jgi:P-type Ca2+ transporter type 2C